MIEAYEGNPLVVRMLDAIDDVSEAAVPAATVVGVLKTGGGVELATVTFEADGGGDYHGEYAADVGLAAGSTYLLEITATVSGTQVGFWVVVITVKERRE